MLVLGFRCISWALHPVIVTRRDDGDYMNVLLDSVCTTIAGWGEGGAPRLCELLSISGLPRDH